MSEEREAYNGVHPNAERVRNPQTLDAARLHIRQMEREVIEANERATAAEVTLARLRELFPKGKMIPPYVCGACGQPCEGDEPSPDGSLWLCEHCHEAKLLDMEDVVSGLLYPESAP